MPPQDAGKGGSGPLAHHRPPTGPSAPPSRHSAAESRPLFLSLSYPFG